MAKSLKVVLFLNAVLLIWNLLGTTGSAQRPPQINQEGIPYFMVNINPTDLPPMVNINPQGAVPKVDVVHMPNLQLPELKVAPIGCENRENYLTAVGRSIAGPLVITYLNVTGQTQVTLTGGQGGNHRIVLSNPAPLANSIYLQVGQQINFENDVMYSGCRP